MRKTLFAILVLILASVSWLRADNAIKLTDNPFDSGTKVAEEKDPRLSQKVSYEAKPKTALTILTDLSKKTNIALVAGWNNLDWQIRDRKMTISAKDVPLSSLMQSIARVMKFKWTRREKDNTYYYRLYMDRKAVIEAERERMLAEQKLMAWRAQQREKMVPDVKKFAAMSDDDLQKMKDQNPYLYALTKQGWTGWLDSLFENVPESEQAWISGQQFALNAAQLPESAQDGLRQMIQSANEFSSTNIALPEDISQVSVMIVPSGINDFHHMFIGMGCSITWPDNNEWGYSSVGTNIMNPEDENVKNHGRDLTSILEHTEPNASSSHPVSNELKDEDDLGEPAIVHEEDPELLTKVKIKLNGNLLSDLQLSLSEAAEFSVVSDYFPSRYQQVSISDGEYKIKDILSQFDSRRYNWEKHSSTFEFRDRDWFWKRSLQIPEAWIEPWRQAALDTGMLDINSLAEIAELSGPQVIANIENDEVLGGNWDLTTAVGENRYLLRWYHHLDVSQKSQLFSKSGINLQAGTDDQLEYVRSMLWLNPSILTDEQVAVPMHATRTKQGDQYQYSFTMTPVDGSKPIEWKFKTPKFEKKTDSSQPNEPDRRKPS